MKLTQRTAVIATIVYAAIFDYPLTAEEIARWLLFSPAPDNISSIKKFPSRKGYVCLSARSLNLVAKRQQKAEIAKRKWLVTEPAIRLLQNIPTLQLIGVSGGLAMNNAEEDDDIDLFLIVAPKTIWISRLMVLCVLELLGKRRRFGMVHEKDLFCPNMFLCADNLTLSLPQQDLYSAHEVLQMVPLFERHGMYQKFLSANEWVKHFLPNAWEWRKKYQVSSIKYRRRGNSFLLSPLYFLLQILDPAAGWLQLQVIKSHRTTELVTDSALQFHPQDARVFVKKQFLKALKKQNIPLDSMIFSGLQ